MLKLYGAAGACSLASHIALEEAGAGYQLELLDLKAGEQHGAAYRRINPKGKVPALATAKGVLTESPVILGYIAQTFPNAELADNDDSYAFGAMQAFNLFLATTVHVGFGRFFKPAVIADEASAGSVKAKAGEAIDKAFGLVEERLSDGRAFIHGERYTVSDPYLYLFARWLAEKGAGHPDAFPLVAAHRGRIEKRPATMRALAGEALGPVAG